jgi:hypothetical protein
MELGPTDPPIILGKVVLKQEVTGIVAVPAPVIVVDVLPTMFIAVILASTVSPIFNRYLDFNFETNIVH